MGQMVERLLADMDAVFCEDGWHASLLDAVGDLTAAQAAWTPSPPRNSVWRIVEHVSLWKEDVARRVAGEPRRPAGWEREHDWKDIPEVTDAAWQASLRRLRAAHARLRAELAKRSDADLQVPPPGYEAPLYAALRGVIAHDSYHCGQICYLRALQGIPVEG